MPITHTSVGDTMTQAEFENAINAHTIDHAQTVQSYTIGTVYQNTSGNSIIVAVSAVGHDDAAGIITAYCDNNSSPSTEVAKMTVGASYTGALTFIVPNGYYYKVTASDASGSVQKWTEWAI